MSDPGEEDFRFDRPFPSFLKIAGPVIKHTGRLSDLGTESDTHDEWRKLNDG